MDLVLRSPIVTAAVLILIVIELFWRTRIRGDEYDYKGAAASFGVLAGNLLAAGLGGAIILPVYLGAYALAPVQLPADDWRIWAIGFIGVEFTYYWVHRLNHNVRWMWATHSVHHSAERFAFPTALRLGWTNVLSGGWLLYAPLMLLGFPPALVVTLLFLNLRFQFFLHTEMVGKLGILEYIFNTPSHHRVHHSSDADYLDRNFGGVLIVFDHLFGTFAAEDEARTMRYGLAPAVRSHNPLVIALHEWRRLVHDARRSSSLRDIRLALIGKPGAWDAARRP
ncbi:sterol desaturase family protein [Hyphococcus sp.]|uniref:sterol desaturase family protein n=1 Tax=Hyphococcus sp. TaxID=2038636 RepID=UPI0035C73A59